MLKLFCTAVAIAVVAAAALPWAHGYTAMKYTTTTWSLANSPTLPSAQQPPMGQAYGCAQPMVYPCAPPRAIGKCKPPMCPPPASCGVPYGPACGPVPCGGYAQPCGPAACPPPCNPQSAWDKLITNLWY